jgi:hypothetical protein
MVATVSARQNSKRNACVANLNQLRGRLEEFRVVELLQAMGLGYSTGALHLRRDDGRAGLIYFENGALVSASEIDTEALTLGHVLQQLNYATATQLEHVYQQQTQDPFGKRIGERLIDLGVLTPEQLEEALRTQVLWTVRELALWRNGDYDFHPNEALPHGIASIVISAEDAALEVLRYEHEWDDQLQFLPDGMNTHVVMVFDPPPGHPLIFHPQAWRVLSRVNQQRTARRIATILHMPELDVSRILQPLVREGLLVPLGGQGAPGLPEGAARLSMHDFDLFSLLIEFEQDWLKRRTPTDHLVGIASYINSTMRALGRVYADNGLQLGPDTLRSLLARHKVLEVAGHPLSIENNRIDLDDLAAFSRRSFEGSARGSITVGSEFYETASETLQQALRVSFEAINARVASPQDRSQNQEAWEALFQTLQSPQPFR